MTVRRISCGSQLTITVNWGFLNIFASNDRQQAWKIVVSNSYSANAGLAIEVATALYKAGAPLLIYDAEKLLRVLLKEDYVRLVPDPYHNYIGYQEEGSVYELPWEYECSEDANSALTLEQSGDCLYCRMAARGKGEGQRLAGLQLCNLAYLYSG